VDIPKVYTLPTIAVTIEQDYLPCSCCSLLGGSARHNASKATNRTVREPRWSQ